MQLDRDGRDRDVDDEGVDPEHELRGDDDRKHPPAARGIDGRCDDLVHGEASSEFCCTIVLRISVIPAITSEVTIPGFSGRRDMIQRRWRQPPVVSRRRPPRRGFFSWKRSWPV